MYDVERKLYFITFKLKKIPLDGMLTKQDEGWTPHKRTIVLSTDEYKVFTAPPSQAVAIVTMSLLRPDPTFQIADVQIREAMGNEGEVAHVQA